VTAAGTCWALSCPRMVFPDHSTKQSRSAKQPIRLMPDIINKKPALGRLTSDGNVSIAWDEFGGTNSGQDGMFPSSSLNRTQREAQSSTYFIHSCGTKLGQLPSP
jgi:hypothetical protein